MAVAWESVKEHLVTGLPAVVGTSVEVIDGPVVKGNSPSAYITIGHAPSADDVTAGSFTQDVGPDGYSASESGTVVCELAAVTGATDIPSVFATFDAIATWLQDDMTLGGILTADATCTAAANVVQAQTTVGAVQRLLLTISYTTRL